MSRSRQGWLLMSDGDLVVLDGQRPVLILEDDGDLGDAQRAPPLRVALEDHVGHLAAAQRLRALFAQDPAHGVHDVALAASVRADEHGEAGLEDEARLVGERLEAVELKFVKSHPTCPSPALP